MMYPYLELSDEIIHVENLSNDETHKCLCNEIIMELRKRQSEEGKKKLRFHVVYSVPS